MENFFKLLKENPEELLRQINENPPQNPKEWEAFQDDLMAKPKTEKRDHIEARANRKLYHDFESSVAAPKILLIRDLHDAGFSDMVENVKQGKYDF